MGVKGGWGSKHGRLALDGRCTCNGRARREQYHTRSSWGLFSSHPGSSKQALKGLRPVSQTATQKGLHTELRSQVLKGIWEESFSDRIGKEFLTR